MNDNSKSNDQTEHMPAYQLQQLSQLIDEVRQCCEDKQFIEIEEFGLPYAEIRCLMLFGGERYLTVKGISERLEVAKSRVTKIVNSINEKGLAERAADPSDGRVRLLRLTPAGHEIVERITAFQKQIQIKILEKLDPSDRRRVISGLELLRAAMQEAKIEMESTMRDHASGVK